MSLQLVLWKNEVKGSGKKIESNKKVLLRIVLENFGTLKKFDQNEIDVVI